MIASKRQFSVGYCAVADVQSFPRDVLEKNRTEGLNALREIGLEPKVFADFIADSDKVTELIDFLKEQKIDVAIVNFSAWLPGGLALKIVSNLPGVHFILWAFGNYSETLTITGLLEATSILANAGKKFYAIWGAPDLASTKDKLDRIIRCIEVVKSLSETKIGMIGYNCPGMLDSTTDEVALRKMTGVDLLHLDLSELFSLSDTIADGLVSESLENVRRTVGKIMTKEKDLFESIRGYFALKEMATRNGLSGFGIRCWPELKVNLSQRNMTPCYAISRLADEGVIGTCEADMTSNVTMIMMNKLAGFAPVSLDYNTIDPERNRMAFWHCGANAFSLAGATREIELRIPTNGGLMQLDCGTSVEFYMKPGVATAAKISRDFDEMIITTGRIVEPARKFRGGIAEMEFDCSVDSFMQVLVEQGSGHHLCLVHGDIKEDLQTICKMLDLKAVMVN